MVQGIKSWVCRFLYRLLNDERFNHECDVTEGILAEECGQILTDFLGLYGSVKS